MVLIAHSCPAGIPSVLITGLVVDTWNVAATTAGSPGHRERENRRYGRLQLGPPPPPPPGFPNATLRTPMSGENGRTVRDLVIPAPVRSVPNNPNRWCLRLPTIMQPRWDIFTAPTNKSSERRHTPISWVSHPRNEPSCKTSEPRSPDTRRALKKSVQRGSRPVLRASIRQFAVLRTPLNHFFSTLLDAPPRHGVRPSWYDG